MKLYYSAYPGLFTSLFLNNGEIMNNYDVPHEGIELDLIDLSQLNQSKESKGIGRTRVDPLDHRVFVKSLFAKIENDQSFLTFSRQISDVNKILSLKYSSASDIANVILMDVALTSKLLILVNSSFYGQFSNKGITNISEAMIILGTEEIKLAAASLKIYELMRSIASIQILKEKTIKGLLRSIIAKQVAMDQGYKDIEAIQISAMLYDFGEYLVALYAPDRFISIEIVKTEFDLSREKASKSILGVTYSQLGRVIAQKWRLPQEIIDTMRPVNKPKHPSAGLSTKELHQYVCLYANDICEIKYENGEKNKSKKIVQISSAYKGIFDIPSSKTAELLRKSWEKIVRHASLLQINLNTDNLS